jgi:NAD(P)-dependent dehydrogenase (short-subunit alcohol dehydrogenase family)
VDEVLPHQPMRQWGCSSEGVNLSIVLIGCSYTPRGISEEEVVRDVMLLAQPTKKLITVEQVAEIVLFLCSEQASSITGSILPVDGGWTAK